MLIEGWSSPRCKLLLDLAPSTSRVRATQKYFRVMTRDGDTQARIVVLLPTNLPASPALPIDLFGALPDFVHGRLIERAIDAGGAGELVEDARTPIASVSLESQIVATGAIPSLPRCHERGDMVRASRLLAAEAHPRMPCQAQGLHRRQERTVRAGQGAAARAAPAGGDGGARRGPPRAGEALTSASMPALQDWRCALDQCGYFRKQVLVSGANGRQLLSRAVG